MPDIFHYFTINAPVKEVYQCISTPDGLDSWWSKRCSGTPAMGEKYLLSFGADYNWEAVVSKMIPCKEFELTITKADQDWDNSLVGFALVEQSTVTEVRFYHKGWKEDNNHFRISNYCWAMYLRILKRYLEFREKVCYEDRLNV